MKVLSFQELRRCLERFDVVSLHQDHYLYYDHLFASIGIQNLHINNDLAYALTKANQHTKLTSLQKLHPSSNSSTNTSGSNGSKSAVQHNTCIPTIYPSHIPTCRENPQLPTTQSCRYSSQVNIENTTNPLQSTTCLCQELHQNNRRTRCTHHYLPIHECRR